MNISIRKFLLINLLLAITITTSLTAIGIYSVDQKNIQRHVDSLMALYTLSYQSLLGKNPNTRNLPNLQTSINRIPEIIERYADFKILSEEQVEYADKFIFQIWDDTGTLLLKSPNAPDSQLSDIEEGFSNKVIDGKLWRVFTATDVKSGITTISAERFDFVRELGKSIAKDNFLIILITFSLSGFFVWFIIGKGLNRVNRLAQDVGKRDPNYLEPVNLHGVPEEIRPVIDSLNQLFNKLRLAFDREKRFSGDAAHELRTPLAVLKTYAQVALNTSDAKERTEMLKKVITGVDRSTHVVTQLLTLSRYAEPELTQKEEFGLDKVVQEMAALMVPSAHEKNIELEMIELTKTIPPITGQKTAISILVRNLLDNAIRYTQEGGKVLIKIDLTGNKIILQVIDNGPGIPLELRKRVLERFYRVLGTKSQGSGLGLAIVKQICDVHQASFDLKSREDNEQGLVVEITFPLTA